MTSQRQATRRLMALEFRQGLDWRSWITGRRAARERLPDAWWLLIAGLLLLWLLFSVGTTRHSLVDWRQTSFLSLAGAVAWVLWALGGAVAGAGALRTGWAAEIGATASAGTWSGAPLTGTLPLGVRSVYLAKAAGRTGALLVHLLIALAILAVARVIMTGFGLVATAPSLLDPWLIDAIFVHFGLMIASLRIAEAGRWQSESVAGARFVAYILVAIAALFMAGRIFPVDPAPNWWSVSAAALAFGVVVLLALLQSVPQFRALEESLVGGIDPQAEVALPTLRAQHRRYGLLSWYNAIALRGLGGMRDRTAQWLGSTAASVARTAAFFIVTGAVLSGGLLAVTAVARLVSPGSSLGVDPAFFDFIGGAFGFLFAVGIGATGLTVWPESSSSILNWVSSGRMARRGPHMGDLLPERPERVWRERLMTLPVIWVLLGIAGAVTFMALQLLQALLDPTTALTDIYWAHPLIVVGICAIAAAISLCLFITVPMLHRARKVVPTPVQALGCLGFAAFAGGIIAPVIAFVTLGTGGMASARILLVSEVFGAALLAWLAVGLVCSYVLWKPGSWRHDDTGAATDGAITRAMFVYGFSVLGWFLAGTTFHMIIGVMEWGTQR
ncbi:MAG: hypothetical protein GF393_12350 [Armatimonadia bacterium]|nr:hypothetical protein [Armatimonadia bacterium]